MAVAVAVLVLAGFVMLPAVHNSRFQARLAACRDNLRYLGVSLASYSQQHEGRFPAVPAEGKLAAAGVYAPTLVSARLSDRDAARDLPRVGLGGPARSPHSVA